jgi:hypothetical protein
MATPRMHLVLRSYGGDNLKRRPPYYCKLLTLASFVRAASQVPNADIRFLNDGPVPAAHLDLMMRFGTVTAIPGGPIGMRGSYWQAVTLPERHPEWDADDILSLNEDDYLFRADAFTRVASAAEQIPEASYFSVYGDRPDYSSPDVRDAFCLPHEWTPAPDRETADGVWFNQPGITSTFSGRVGAFVRDRAVFRHCMIPFRRRFLDHETCLIYQGFVPYRGLDLLTGLPGDFVPGIRGVLRSAFLVPFRVALNIHALLRRDRHLLYCLSPNEATHLDLPVISPDHDWAAEARTVPRWAAEAGLDQVAQTLDDFLLSIERPSL